MFDFSKITDAIGGLVSGGQQQSPLDASGIAELLNNAGIDPAMLAGLNQEENLNLLQQYGIDPGQFDLSQLGQLGDLVQGGQVGERLTQMAQDWLRSRGG